MSAIVAFTGTEHAMPAAKEVQKIVGKDQQTQQSADRPLIGVLCPNCQFHSSHTGIGLIAPGWRRSAFTALGIEYPEPQKAI